MSEQALDLRRSMQIVRRHKAIVGIFAALGLLAGAGYSVHQPPTLTSSALVALPSTTRDMPTQVVIATSDHVLAGALPSIHPSMSLQTLGSNIQVKSLTPNIMSVSAQGKTAAQAEGAANAVVKSYVAYARTTNSPTGRVEARVLEMATDATGTPPLIRLLITAGLGALLGALIGAIMALAISRNDRRLRERDQIADAIGVPVLASIPVGHPSNAADWMKLLDDYKPGVVHGWSMRKALDYLGLTDIRGGNSTSLTILSLSSDQGALALGPQLAVYAASLGVPTTLVIGPQQDANATAALRSACAAPQPGDSRRSARLRVGVRDQGSADESLNAGLTAVVAVVDADAPQMNGTMPTTATVLGVTAGVATAEQLARVAVNAAVNGRQIAGIFVADPDPTDHTTGRLPQLARSAQHRMPTRIAGTPLTPTETRR